MKTSRMPAWVVVVVALFAALGGCTLLTSFDPEGQPCDLQAPPDEQCIPDSGYACVDGKCTMKAP